MPINDNAPAPTGLDLVIERLTALTAELQQQAAAAIADEWDGIWHRPASLRCDHHLAAADRLMGDW
jgi:hypothetical protein